jgi:hypothetical protein
MPPNQLIWDQVTLQFSSEVDSSIPTAASHQSIANVLYVNHL